MAQEPKAKRCGRLRPMMEELLDAIMDLEMFRELEAGCDGDGPVVRAYRLLKLRQPDELKAYLAEA